MRKTRKNYSADEKVAILRRHLIDRISVADFCDERAVSEWLQSGRKTPAPKRHSAIEQSGEVKGINVTELFVP
jgi:hypothetical protein